MGRARGQHLRLQSGKKLGRKPGLLHGCSKRRPGRAEPTARNERKAELSDQGMRADVEAIEKSVTDYFESWFDGNVARMQRCLHPRLAKRRPPREAETDLIDVSHDEMIEDVSGGAKPQYDRQIAVTVLDVAGDIATVKVLSEPFDEYVHLARIEGRWLIVNTLYRWRPAQL